jgi:predicted Zn-dependent protease with MMP-like domain
MPPATRTYAPDTAALERLADAALARLPEHFRALLGNVVLRVVEEAEDEVLAELELESPV